MATPPMQQRRSKTLFEIAAERQAELGGQGISATSSIKPENIVQLKIGEDGKIQADDDARGQGASGGETQPETPWLDALLLATSLAAVHFTLEVLTVHQYSQELRFPPIVAHTLLVALPTLTVVVALFHGLLLPARTVSAAVRGWVLAGRQLVYLLTANVAGCYLIQMTNDEGYYAVMKNAPGIGTLWVWAVLELGLLGALAGVVGPGFYAWWNGYGII